MNIWNFAEMKPRKADRTLSLQKQNKNEWSRSSKGSNIPSRTEGTPTFGLRQTSWTECTQDLGPYETLFRLHPTHVASQMRNHFLGRGDLANRPPHQSSRWSRMNPKMFRKDSFLNHIAVASVGS